MGLCIALMIISSWIYIPIGPIPITMQTAVLFIISYILGAKKAVVAIIVYIVLGLFGLPIFAGFSGGISKIVSPSFGFILSYIPSAWIVGSFNRLKLRELVMVLTFTNILIYIIGISYMLLLSNLYLGNDLTLTGAIAVGMLPFIPGDIVKIGLSSIIIKRIGR